MNYEQIEALAEKISDVQIDGYSELGITSLPIEGCANYTSLTQIVRRGISKLLYDAPIGWFRNGTLDEVVDCLDDEFNAHFAAEQLAKYVAFVTATD